MSYMLSATVNDHTTKDHCNMANMSVVIVFVILVLDKLFAIKLMVHLKESFLMDVKMVINLN